jgi:hypothetical protein
VDVPRGSKLYKVVRVDRESRVCLGQIESQNEQTNEIKYKTKTDAEIKTEEGNTQRSRSQRKSIVLFLLPRYYSGFDSPQ